MLNLSPEDVPFDLPADAYIVPADSVPEPGGAEDYDEVDDEALPDAETAE